MYWALFTFNLVDSASIFSFCLGIVALFDYFQIVRVPLIFSFFIKFLPPDISLCNFYLPILSSVFFFLEQCLIGTDSEQESRKSVLSAWLEDDYDDYDDDDDYK